MKSVEGTIIAVHGPLVRVQVGDRTLVMSSRRRLKWEGGTPQSPQLVVGDRVVAEMAAKDGVVVAVNPRVNSLRRAAPHSGQPQLLAANVDQALLVFAAHRPEPKRGLLDRIPLLFAGKLAIKEIGVLSELAEAGVVSPPGILPPNIADGRALAGWMTLWNLLNRIDLGEMETHLADALS